MSLCFIQLALKVPLLGSFWTARDSGPGSPGRVRAESYHPQGTHLKPGCVGELGKGGRSATCIELKGPFEGGIYVCVLSLPNLLCFPRASLLGRPKNDAKRRKYIPPDHPHNGLKDGIGLERN